MTAPTISSSGIGSALDGVASYAFTTLTNNITVFVLFLCFGIAFMIFQFIWYRFGAGAPLGELRMERDYETARLEWLDGVISTGLYEKRLQEAGFDLVDHERAVDRTRVGESGYYGYLYKRDEKAM